MPPPPNPSTRRAIQSVLKAHPDAGHRTLAKRLHQDNPVLFTSIEQARSALRQYTGNNGGKSRQQSEHRGTARAPRKPGALPPLPKSEATPWEPFVIEGKKVLILGDIHLRFHDVKAIEAALKYGQKFGPDVILLNGDVFDFYQLSRFDKDSSVAKLKDEIDAGHAFFTHLRKRFPKARIVFRYGNHDRRWDLHLMNCAPLLWEALPSLKDIWHKDAGIVDAGVEVIYDKCIVQLGKLPVLHGDELPQGMTSPVNAARGAFIKTFESVYVNHFHQQSTNPARTLSGRTVLCWSSGCLCGLNPHYRPINQWTLGFGTVEIERDGDFRVLLHHIIDGKIY